MEDVNFFINCIAESDSIPKNVNVKEVSKSIKYFSRYDFLKMSNAKSVLYLILTKMSIKNSNRRPGFKNSFMIFYGSTYKKIKCEKSFKIDIVYILYNFLKRQN